MSASTTRPRPGREPTDDKIPPRPAVALLSLPDDTPLSNREIAGEFGVTTQRVEAWVRNGRLGSKKFNERCVRVLVRHVRAFIDEAPERAPDPDVATSGRPKVRTRYARAA